jgi:hypothetical protein
LDADERERLGSLLRGRRVFVGVLTLLALVGLAFAVLGPAEVQPDAYYLGGGFLIFFGGLAVWVGRMARAVRRDLDEGVKVEHSEALIESIRYRFFWRSVVMRIDGIDFPVSHRIYSHFEEREIVGIHYTPHGKVLLTIAPFEEME